MRFENRLNKENLKINTLNPCCDDEEGTAINVFEMVKTLNELTMYLIELVNVSYRNADGYYE